MIDTAQYFPRVMRKDYKLAMNITETAVDDPDVTFYENYYTGSPRNYTKYSNPEVDKLIDQQSMETDNTKRKKIVWQIERKLVEDDVRPILFYNKGANCHQPYVKNLTTMVNSIYNAWRFDDLWLAQGVGSSAKR